MFLNYDEFLFESVTNKVEKLIEIPRVSSAVKDCIDGKHSQIQITFIQGAKSYVGVATNSGSPHCEVFHTSDPGKALLGIIISNTGKTDAEEIISIINTKDSLVEFSVFPGEKKLTDEELMAKYNLMYSDYSQITQHFTGTPVYRQH